MCRWSIGPLSVADAQIAAVLQPLPHEVLGAIHGLAAGKHRWPSSAAMAAERLHPVPCEWGVSMRGRTKRSTPASSTRMSTAVPPDAVAALEQHCATASGAQRLGLRHSLGFACRRLGPEQDRSLRQVGRHQRRQRHQVLARAPRPHRARAARRRWSPPSPGPRPRAAERAEPSTSRHGLHDVGVGQHPRLDGADVEVGEHRVELAGDEGGRDRLDALHAAACSGRSAR